MYLHELAEQEASFTKEEMQLGKHTEYEKRLITYYLDVIAKEKDSSKSTTLTAKCTTNGGGDDSTAIGDEEKQQRYSDPFLEMDQFNFNSDELIENSNNNSHTFTNNDSGLQHNQRNNSKEYSVRKFYSLRSDSNVGCFYHDAIFTNNRYHRWFVEDRNERKVSPGGPPPTGTAITRNRNRFGLAKFRTTQRYGYY